MPEMDIRIHHPSDDPIWPDLTSETVEQIDVEWQVVFVEAGMASGDPSVMLRLNRPDGAPVIAETSLALFAGAVIAARGAFPKAFEAGPLEAPEDPPDLGQIQRQMIALGGVLTSLQTAAIAPTAEMIRDGVLHVNFADTPLCDMLGERRYRIRLEEVKP